MQHQSCFAKRAYLQALFVFILAFMSISWRSDSVVVPIAYETHQPPDGNGTMDSIAIWVAPNPDSSILFVTDKSRDYLEMHNPVTNTYIGRIGGSGTTPGRLARPNGVAVGYQIATGKGEVDAVFAVERDNNRVSAFSLPDRRLLGIFGENDLDEPYGIALYRKGDRLQAWITSTGSSPDEVFVYDIVPTDGGIRGTLAFSFEIDATLESLVIDPAKKRAYICDESTEKDVMIFDLQGHFMQRMGSGIFTDDPEGIVLYDLGGNRGYIIVADQEASPTEFEVFSRETYAYLGNFTGKTTGTDGIALTQAALPNLPQGAFFALHSDRVVHAYDWSAIAGEMGLEINVKDPITSVRHEPEARNGSHRNLSNYPNPFNPETKIQYQVPYHAFVQLDIYDSNGQHLAGLVHDEQSAGAYEVTWRGPHSGVFFARLIIGNETFSWKLAQLK